MLNDGFAASERSRNAGGTALGDREHTVNRTASGYHGFVTRQLFDIGTRFSYGPLLHERQDNFALFAVCLKHGVGDLILTALYGSDGIFSLIHGRDGKAQLYYLGFLYITENVASGNFIADLDGRFERPLLFMVKPGHINASGNIRSGHLTDNIQRALDTVIDVGNKTRSELAGQRLAGGVDLVARTDAGGLFIYLNGGVVASYFNDFADQLILADADDVGNVRFSHTGRHDKRTGNLYYRSCDHYNSTLLFAHPGSGARIYGIPRGGNAVSVFQNIHADCLFDVALDGSHAVAEIALNGRYGDYGRRGMGFVFLDDVLKHNGKGFGDENYFIPLPDGASELLSASLSVRCGKCRKPDRAEALYALSVAYNSYTCHKSNLRWSCRPSLPSAAVSGRRAIFHIVLRRQRPCRCRKYHP